MKFSNISNPGKIPVEGDTVSYTVLGRTTVEGFDYSLFEYLLNISASEKEAGISPVAFRQLFTTAELLSIDNAEWSDSLTTQSKALIRTVVKTFESATIIPLDAPDTLSGVGALVSVGLLSKERADTILLGKKPV